MKIKKIKSIALLLLLLGSFFSSYAKDTIPPQSLVGTKWKLVGLVDTLTNDIKVLEPKDCESCYGFLFYNESEASGRVVANYLSVTLRPTLRLFVTTESLDGKDGNFFVSIIETIISYELRKNELRFYYNDGKNYLKFKEVGELKWLEEYHRK